jgi:hypothetical protein
MKKFLITTAALLALSAPALAIAPLDVKEKAELRRAEQTCKGVVEWMHRYSKNVLRCQTFRLTRGDVVGCADKSHALKCTTETPAHREFDWNALVHKLDEDGDAVCISDKTSGPCWWTRDNDEVIEFISFGELIER